MGENSEWVSLHEASEILGVHPATVRNWADEGKITSRRTPGKHRRFRKSDLMQYVRSQGEWQPLEVRVIIQNALGQTRMQVGEGNLSDIPWYAAMSEETRASMRTYGRQVLDDLRAYLTNGAQDNDLATAIKLGQQYATKLADEGLTLPQAMRGFFYFGDFVLNSILTWSEVTPPRSAPEWATLLRQVNTFMNAMLLSIAEYYEEE